LIGRDFEILYELFFRIPNNYWETYTEENPKYLKIDINSKSMVNGFPGLKCDDYYSHLYKAVRNALKNNEF
jgi:hypothetical protein